jgi:uncharacterized lipoprotein YmbA
MSTKPSGAGRTSVLLASLRLLLLLLSLAAAACASVLPKPAKSEFFVLSALEPPAAAPAPAIPSVLLGQVVVPSYLDRRELVTRLASNQLAVADLELWAEPLRDSVPRTIARDLGAVMGEGRVARLPWTAPQPADLVVSIELLRFEKTTRQTVELEATWLIADGRDGARSTRRSTRLSLGVGAPGTEAAVRVMSDALARLSRTIAADLGQWQTVSEARR